MTDPPNSTMAPPAAANPPSANQTTRTNPTSPQATTAAKFFVTRDFNLVFRAFFPTPGARKISSNHCNGIPVLSNT